MVKTYRPENLQEALRIRRETHAVPLAGGTDLMVRYRSWAGTLPKFPWPVLFINHLTELKTMGLREDGLHIGAGVTLSEIEREMEAPQALRAAVSEMAAPALRNLGTLAGNICNASPAGDAVCVLYALDAQVVLTSLSGARTVSVMDFITGPGRKDLNDDELMTDIIIPHANFSHVSYRKVGTRKANALSKMSFCALAKTKLGRIDDVRIAFGAVGPTVVRSWETEKKLLGMDADDLKDHLSAIHDDYDAMIHPIDDQRSTAVYRKQVSLNLLDQFLQNLVKEL
ncbi:MAG: FAD binding domain-containing protein [Spirochaetia bacterium]|nr:FAD binding domain-containing protein [Spirochaetia bacterium]